MKSSNHIKYGLHNDPDDSVIHKHSNFEQNAYCCLDLISSSQTKQIICLILLHYYVKCEIANHNKSVSKLWNIKMFIFR